MSKSIEVTVELTSYSTLVPVVGLYMTTLPYNHRLMRRIYDGTPGDNLPPACRHVILKVRKSDKAAVQVGPHKRHAVSRHKHNKY